MMTRQENAENLCSNDFMLSSVVDRDDQLPLLQLACPRT